MNMQKNYSTCILPENDKQLLFSIVAGSYLFHCWENIEKNCYVLIKETNDTRNITPNQLMNFTLTDLKQYLYTTTDKLRDLKGVLYLNLEWWNRKVAYL